MMPQSKTVLIRVLGTEIAAVQRDIAASPPTRSQIPPNDLMAPAGDVREQWLVQLRRAATDLEAVRAI